jgi:thioredoxin reductase
MSKKQISVAVLGLGPAGISSAIQLHRYGLRPKIFEPSDRPGLLKNANFVENYPGFPDGISGPELYASFRKHLDRFGPDIAKERVERIAREGEEFIVETDISTGRFEYVVVATGTRPLKWDLPHPPGKVYYEVADVPAENRKVVIMGGGDAAFDYALNLERQGKEEITIVCRGESAKCLERLEDRCRGTGIEILYGTAIRSVTGENDLLKVVLDSGRILKADCMLCALGREPVLDLLDPDLRDVVDRGRSVKGMFLVGDLKNGLKRQVGIAVGDGLRAAMEIEEMIRST